MEKMDILGNLPAMIKFQEESIYSIQVLLSVITENKIMNGLEMSMPATLNALGFNLP